MARRVLAAACSLMLLWAGGCRHETVRPVPGMMLSTGMLLRSEKVPLASELELRRIELLHSKISNDFYPLNVPSATSVDRFVSQLYVREGLKWKFLDFIEMRLARRHDAPNLSPDGKRIIYERPDVSPGEGEYPRAYPPDRRTHRVAIYDVRTHRRFLMDRFAELYALGYASFWSPDGQVAAITTTCYPEAEGSNGGETLLVSAGPCRQLALVDPCGQVILDAEALPALVELEFISFSPDGSRIAALRPVEPRHQGRNGGTLVEVDPRTRTATDLAEVTPQQACRYLDHFERMVVWDADGHCRLEQ